MCVHTAMSRMTRSETVPSKARPQHRRNRARWAWVALVALGTLAIWGGWLGWDQSYDVDPATGRQSGPYQRWQVIGCVMCLVLLAAIAARWLRLLPVVLTMSVVFSLAFAVDGATSSEADGLWGVGAVMVFIGVAVGSAIVGGASSALRRRQARRFGKS